MDTFIYDQAIMSDIRQLDEERKQRNKLEKQQPRPPRRLPPLVRRQLQFEEATAPAAPVLAPVSSPTGIQAAPVIQFR